MAFLTILMIAVGLSMDAMAVSLGVGTTEHVNDRRSKLRLAMHFGIFQTLMTLLGWLAGSAVARFISSVDHWVAFGLLAYVGITMVRSGSRAEVVSYKTNPSKGNMMVMLSVATSLDAMAVGLSMAFLHVDVLYPALVIGVVTFGLSIAALLLGNKLGEKFGKKMEVIGGIVLIGIGMEILATHMLALS
jgi:manganese efflux pump family protein